MTYFLDLFTPETWLAFLESGATVTGFRERQWQQANRVSEGDIFLCYLTRLSRWCGILRAESTAYRDNSPIRDELNEFTVRFKVKPIVTLDFESSIPIHDDKIWNELSITNQHEKGTTSWTGFFRASLNKFTEADGAFLVDLVKRQQTHPKSYPLTEKDNRALARIDKEPIPNGDENKIKVVDNGPEPDVRESIKYQAKVAQIGAEMGFRIWVPRNDKSRVLELIPATMREKFLDDLPLKFDHATMRTVEQIDVLWLRGRSMSRAFEVEHTTAIYSGLLRMADLLALQPDIDIKLHIVAPTGKRDQVLREIGRPAFSGLGKRPIHAQCSFLSYDSIDSLGAEPHLAHMSHTIIAEYEESAEV